VEASQDLQHKKKREGEWMEGEEESRIMKALKPNSDQYPCVWYSMVICPIRTKWKLAPENLTPWCTVCKQIGYLDEQRKLSESKTAKTNETQLSEAR